MQPAISVQDTARARSAAPIEALCLSYFRKLERARRAIVSRVRITIEGGGTASIVELPVDGSPCVASHAKDVPYDVEIVATEPVLRAIAAGRNPVAMLLLGRLRVRGNLAHIDELARRLEQDREDASHG